MNFMMVPLIKHASKHVIPLWLCSKKIVQWMSICPWQSNSSAILAYSRNSIYPKCYGLIRLLTMNYCLNSRWWDSVILVMQIIWLNSFSFAELDLAYLWGNICFVKWSWWSNVISQSEMLFLHFFSALLFVFL